MAIIIVILVIYMAGMLAIGFAGKKKSETMTDFLTAGKSGGMFVMVCTYIGAHVATVSSSAVHSTVRNMASAVCGSVSAHAFPMCCSHW